MDYKFLEISTRIAIGQFSATIIEYDVLDGYSGLFPVYVAQFDTGEIEPIHHTDITGLIYDNPMPVEVIEGRKAYRAEHGDDEPDPAAVDEYLSHFTGEPIRFSEETKLIAEIETLRADLAIARATQDQLRDELTVVTAEQDKLVEVSKDQYLRLMHIRSLISAFASINEGEELAEAIRRALADLASLRQKLEGAESWLTIARATQEKLRDEVTALAALVESQNTAIDEQRQQIDLLKQTAASRDQLIATQEQVIEALQAEYAAAKMVIAEKLEEWKTKTVQPLVNAEAENERLRTALQLIANNAPADDQLTDYEMIVAGQEMIVAGHLARRVLGQE